MTPTKDKSSMPDVIYAGLMHETVSDEYWLRCDIEQVGVNDEHFTKTSTINAQLDLAINYLEDNCQAHALKILKEMRGTK